MTENKQQADFESGRTFRSKESGEKRGVLRSGRSGRARHNHQRQTCVEQYDTSANCSI